MKKISFAGLENQYRELEGEIKEKINKVLEHGQYVMGEEVAKLEAELIKYTGSKNCITVSSGTDALLISLMAIGVAPGDEIITTPFTYIATAEVIVRLGCKPIYVDVELETGNIDPCKIEEKITQKTKAIIPVSLFGQPADFEKINEIAEKYENIVVIEDGAQSFGAEYKKKKSCNLSKIGCTSFFPSKPLGCYGDGGAIFTNDERVAEKCRQIRVHGQRERYVHEMIGIGGRMDTIQCAIVLAKLGKFESEVQRRTEIGEIYNNKLKKGGIKTIEIKKDVRSVYGQYTIILNEREKVKEKLQLMGVPTVIHYPIPVNEQKGYWDPDSIKHTKNSKELSQKVLSLPMNAYLTNEEINKICESLAEAVGRR